VVLPATPFLFFFFLLKTKANLKLQNLEFENSDQHETNFVGKRTKIWKLVGEDFLLVLEVQPLNTRNQGNHQTRKRNMWSR
jgi:hypothetical protein